MVRSLSKPLYWGSHSVCHAFGQESIGQATQLAILLVRSPIVNRAVLVKPLSWTSYWSGAVVNSCIGQVTQLAILLTSSRSKPRCIGESTQLGHPIGQEPYEEPRPVASVHGVRWLP
jgi:hypothetical protein